jgi:hypothetical protein
LTPYIRTFDNALNPHYCKKLIEKFDQDKHVQADPQPDYSRRLYLEISQQPAWLTLLSTLVVTTNELAAAYFSMPQAPRDLVVPDWSDDGYVMAKYQKGDDLALHADGQSTEFPHNGLRIATALYFLNDCEGGELYFPIQDIRISPKLGSAVFFPPDHWFPHEVLRTKTSRYIAQTWLTDPELEVNERRVD